MTALFDMAAEQRLLGAMLLDADGVWLGEIMQRVDEDCYYRGPHGDAHAAIVTCFAEGQTIDVPTVAAKLREAGLHELVGELGTWSSLVGHPGSSLHDAVRVAGLAERRRVYQTLSQAAQAAEDETADLAGLLDQARDALDQPVGSQPLDLVWRDDLDELGDVSWLVDGRIAHGLSVILGRSGSHKTFIACDVACSVASGHRWFGRRVDHGPVLYVLAEGVESAKDRVAAWEADRGARAAKLAVYPHALTLNEPRDQQRLVATCRSVRPKLVVVDTYRRNISGDESDSERAQALVRCVDRMRETCDASTLVVHHTGATLENAHRGRGSQVLYESADTVIGVERDADSGRLTLYNSPSSPIVGKQRNAAEWPPLELWPVDTAAGRVLSTSPAGGGLVEPPSITEPLTRTQVAMRHADGEMGLVDRWIQHGRLRRYRNGSTQEVYVSADAAGCLPA